MFNALSRLVGAVGEAPLPSTVPHELVVAIEAADVFWRPSRSDDDEAGPVVFVVGLGRWAWTDRADAAERIARVYPELPNRLCVRAAKLIQAQIARRNRQALSPGRTRRDPLQRDHHYFGGFFRD